MGGVRHLGTKISRNLLKKEEKYILVSYFHFRKKNKNKKTITTPSCSGPIPAQNSMPKIDFNYSHCFS